jgi:Mg2+ and Co2+ transporter CorA
MGTRLSFPAAFEASLQETIRLAGEDGQNRQSISNQFVHSIVEAVYPVIISECTAVLDYLNKELNHNRSVLEECGDGSCLKRKVREQKLKDAQPRMSSFYNAQHDILNGLLRNLDETVLLFRSVDEENVGTGTQRQQQEQQHPRIQHYRADINTLISHTDHFRRDNDQFTQQRQAILDAILPPSPPSSPAARYLQNRLDQIVFSTNPLLSLTFIATVFGMNLDVFVDGGLVTLATYLITAFVFAFVVFCATIFYKPVVFWIEHFARGRETIVPRIDPKAGGREECDEKWSKKAREIV